MENVKNPGVHFIRRWKALQINKCFYCGIDFEGCSRTGSGNYRLTSASNEHVYPRWAFQGMTGRTVRACVGCNGAKNGFHVSDFRAWRGSPFFCEAVMGQELPDISLHLKLQLVLEGSRGECSAVIRRMERQMQSRTDRLLCQLRAELRRR
jgi:hypothetical protein